MNQSTIIRLASVKNSIYQREPDGSATKIDDAITQEEAKRKVYELNGWNYKPKNNTVK